MPAIVLAGLGADGQADRFVPGVTDFGTGVLREREGRGIQTPAPVASDSGFDLVGDGALALGGALAAAAVAASLALGAGGRRRRILT